MSQGRAEQSYQPGVVLLSKNFHHITTTQTPHLHMSLNYLELFKLFNALSTVLYDVVQGHYLYMDATFPFLVKFYPIFM